MEDFIEYVAKWMVDEPDAVRVERQQTRRPRDDSAARHTKTTWGASSDAEGRLAMAMRTLLSVSGHARAVDTSLDIR